MGNAQQVSLVAIMIIILPVPEAGPTPALHYPELIPESVRARNSEGVILRKLCLNFAITKLQVSG